MIIQSQFLYLYKSLTRLGKNYSSGSSAGGTVAKDAVGNDVIAENWLKAHGPGDRTLTQGLKVSAQLFSVSVLIDFNKLQMLYV